VIAKTRLILEVLRSPLVRIECLGGEHIEGCFSYSRILGDKSRRRDGIMHLWCATRLLPRKLTWRASPPPNGLCMTAMSVAGPNFARFKFEPVRVRWRWADIQPARAGSCCWPGTEPSSRRPGKRFYIGRSSIPLGFSRGVHTRKRLSSPAWVIPEGLRKCPSGFFVKRRNDVHDQETAQATEIPREMHRIGQNTRRESGSGCLR
jgi:hypothetical protein